MTEQNDRFVALDDYQYTAYLKVFRNRQEVGDMLATMLVNLMDEMMQRHDDAWDLVAQQCGFKDHADALMRGYHMTIEWPNRRVRVSWERDVEKLDAE